MKWPPNLTKIWLVLCFSVIFMAIAEVTAFDEYEDIDFELYTREHAQSWHLMNASHGELIRNTDWSAARPTRIFVHGFKSKRKVILRYAEAFLKAGDYNFIAVNWMKGSSTFNYYVAKNRVKKVSMAAPVLLKCMDK